MITKRNTMALKALAIIFIIYGHFIGWIYSGDFKLHDNIVASLTQCGVVLFLFLSGYGVRCSYEKNGLNHFWLKKLMRIYFPFLIVIFPQFLLYIWNYRNHFGDMYVRSACLSAIGLYPNNLIDGTMWFIPFILLQYVMFYFMYKNEKYKNIISILGVCFIYYIQKKYFIWVADSDIYAFSFIIGVFFCERLGQKTWDVSKLVVFGVISFIVSIISIFCWDYSLCQMINGMSTSLCTIIVVICIQRFAELQLLNYLGTISYELYLLEGILFWNKFLYDLVGYNYIGLLIHNIIILLGAMLLKEITEKFNDKLNKKIIENIKGKKHDRRM